MFKKTSPPILLLFWSIAYLLVPSFSWGQTQTQTFIANGTFTPPCGVTSISVQIWGGGGGGAGDGTNAGASGSGGGGGGYSTNTIVVTPGVGVPVTVGAGGAAGVSNANGGVGGTSSIGGTSATGGAGGAFNGGAGGAGGVGNTANGGAGTVDPTIGGTGGTAGGPGGGVGGVGASGLSGTNGTAPGGGGGGGDDEGGGTRNGGAGGAGRIIVTFTVPSAGTDQTLAVCATTTNLAATTPPVGTGTWTCVTNCTGVSITTPTSPTSAVTGLVPGVATTFRWTTTNAGCVASSDDVVVTAVQGQGCWVYCTPDFPSGVYSITNVTFNTINNNSATITAGTTPDNENFTALSTTVTAGDIHTLSVSAVGAAGNTFCITAFFDWNADGDFLDAGETIELGTYTTATATLTAPITIPTTATLGATNFRIIQHFSTCATPCIITGFGQSENYSLVILADPCAMTTPDAGADQDLAVCATSTNLAGNAITYGTGTWILISGSGTIASPNDPSSAVTGLGSGNNVFQWTVTPAVGCPNAPLTDQVTIRTNGFPVVNAGLDQGLCFTNTTLRGSSLPAGSTGLWTVLPAGPVISSPTTRNTAVSGMVAGTTYTFTWTVTNACGPISDAMQVAVSNTVSTAVVGANQTICPTSTTITATDPIVGVGTWTYVSGPAGSNITNPNNNSTTVTSLVVGTYVFRWTVTDTSCVGSSSADISITVNNCQNAISHSATTNQTFTGCNFIYTDDGGAAGSYTEGITMTQTIICPDEPNQYVSITFSALDLGANREDNIIIFTENNPGAPMYAYADGALETSIPLGTPIVSDQMGECLIIQFSSDNSGWIAGGSTGTGWVATTSCTTTAPPATVNPYIVPSNCGGGGGFTLCASVTIDPPTSFQGGQAELSMGSADGGNNDCLGSGESNGTWAYMTVVPQIDPSDPPGNIAFDISGANGQDFDFAIWGPYAGLECPVNNGDAPIRCSFALTGAGGPGECGSSVTGLGYVSNDGIPQTDVSEYAPDDCSNPPGVFDGYVLPIEAQIGDVYILFVNNYGSNNATWDFTYTGTANLGCDPPVLLAIEMAYFNGYNAGNHNVLKWTTSIEANSDFFTVEKSVDGYNWATLGTTEAMGNSQIGHNYALYDNSPYTPTTYYRVKQTNLDGTHSYTRVIAIDMQAKFTGLASELFPNPTSDLFSFVYGGNDSETPVQVQLINTMGQLISQVVFEQVGQNQLLNVDTYNLPSGVYHVAIQQGELRTVKKIVIQK
jgi:hypothetical protein